MKRLIYYNVWFALAVLTASCATVSNVTVSNVSNSGASPAGSMIYALPLTVFDINVLSEEISVVPGPYEKYAGKYLGIQHAPVKAEKIYYIKEIKLHRHLEADPDLIYMVSGIYDPEKYPGLTDLLKDSLVLAATDFSGNLVNAYNFPPKLNDPLYTDLSVKRNFEAEKDIEISRVMPDTNYMARPSMRTALKEKTMEQKAEEAANFIIKLKKRRFKLVAGQYDYMPDGEAMAEALKELARIEDEYLSLFIGKRTVTEISRNYHYAPEAGKVSDRVVLFRFSPENGFVDAREASGIPVMLELEAMHKTRQLEDSKQPLRPVNNVIPYRIADQVNIRVLAGEQVWIEAILPVFQYGVHVSMSLGN